MARSVLIGGNGRPIVTNDVKHSPDAWATLTARIIFPAETAGEDKVIAAAKFQTAIAEILAPHHASHQSREMSALATKGDAHLDAPHDVESYALAAVSAVVAVSKGTPFEAYCARPEWQRTAASEIATHFASSGHIERSIHADKNERKSAAAAAWKLKHHPGDAPAEGA